MSLSIERVEAVGVHNTRRPLLTNVTVVQFFKLNGCLVLLRGRHCKHRRTTILATRMANLLRFQLHEEPLLYLLRSTGEPIPAPKMDDTAFSKVTKGTSTYAIRLCRLLQAIAVCTRVAKQPQLVAMNPQIPRASITVPSIPVSLPERGPFLLQRKQVPPRQRFPPLPITKGDISGYLL